MQTMQFFFPNVFRGDCLSPLDTWPQLHPTHWLHSSFPQKLKLLQTLFIMVLSPGSENVFIYFFLKKMEDSYLQHR